MRKFKVFTKIRNMTYEVEEVRFKGEFITFYFDRLEYFFPLTSIEYVREIPNEKS